MRNLVVCCDGTWNTPDQKHDGIPVPTNVVRLYHALAEKDAEGHEQLGYYHTGVGTEGNWLQRAAGGSFGEGLGKNIQSAYKWLGVNYRPGDRVFLFGFSRGAYTARSLGGLMTICGLLDLSQLPDEEAWPRVETAYSKGYRKRQETGEWAKGWDFHLDADGKPVPIYFLGVWDTVGALGVPDDLALLNLLDNPARYAFHDTRLSDKVLHARHAVAMDEVRASFLPTLWTDIAGRANVQQIWFPGVHCDIGGGYAEKGLADGALAWMMDEAQGTGLAFKKDMRAQVKPDVQDVLHDSCTGVFKHLRTHPRSVPPVREKEKALHGSVWGRRKNPPIAQAPYRPTTLLGVGKTQEILVFAAQHWNDTGLYLEAGGCYRFRATGQWVDGSIKCGPGGTNDGKFHLAELAQMAGSVLGKVEEAFRSLAKNKSADFQGTRREEKMPWFSLVGMVANGGNPGKDSTPAPSDTFLIGDALDTYKVEQSGYLFCFANDAWHFYDNNRGSVVLTVERVE